MSACILWWNNSTAQIDFEIGNIEKHKIKIIVNGQRIFQWWWRYKFDVYDGDGGILICSHQF
jgi:hypothetical protein